MPIPCPGCNKFPTLSPSDPEVELEIDEGQITGTVRFVLTSECCGEEMKETTFDIDYDASTELDGKLKTWDVANAQRDDFAWPSEICENDKHETCDGRATDDRGNIAQCSCPCHKASTDFEVEGEATFDETKIKGKKAWEMELKASVTAEWLTEPVEILIKDSTLQADMEDMV